MQDLADRTGRARSKHRRRGRAVLARIGAGSLVLASAGRSTRAANRPAAGTRQDAPAGPGVPHPSPARLRASVAVPGPSVGLGKVQQAPPFLIDGIQRR